MRPQYRRYTAARRAGGVRGTPRVDHGFGGGWLLNLGGLALKLYFAVSCKCILVYPTKYISFTYPSVSWGVHMFPVDVIRIHMYRWCISMHPNVSSWLIQNTTLYTRGYTSSRIHLSSIVSRRIPTTYPDVSRCIWRNTLRIHHDTLRIQQNTI